MLVLDKIFNEVKKQGNQTAVMNVNDGLSYKALWEKSDRLAGWIDSKLRGNKNPVVVFGHKSPMMLVCFLACAKSGRAYCPVDISMPAERVESIIDSVGNDLVLSTERLDVSEKTVADMDTIEEACRIGEPISRESWVGPENVFYIIFTSGSTGKPKGVQITHDNLSRFTDWSVTLGSNPRAKRGRVFLNQAPFSFDLSVMDVYTSLVSGGTLYCLDKALQSDSAKMLEYMKKGEINYWVSTPSFANMCLADKNFDSGLMPDIEAFLFCGETLPKETAAELYERFPKAKIINTYGPTESTVAVTAVEITDEMLNSDGPLPIGVAKQGTEIKIDNNEIVILGDTVSCGYFNDRQNTEKVFSVDRSSGQQVRSYRTGDEGYFQNGMLYYRGRIDLQIKMHGYRIELGDIEANILKLPGITAAAVVPRKKDEKIRDLAAFVKAEDMEGSFSDRQELRSKLKEKLPEYMVPKKVIFIDRMPITNNGKIDRRRLEGFL